MNKYIVLFLVIGAGFMQLHGYKPDDVNKVARHERCQNCDLSNANMSRWSLFEADLRGANLSGANLTGARFTRTLLSNANLTGANLTGANLTEGAFCDSSTQLPSGFICKSTDRAMGYIGFLAKK